MKEIHKPNCKINQQCLVEHYGKLCPGPYGKCDCGAEPPRKPSQEDNYPLYKASEAEIERIGKAFTVEKKDGFIIGRDNFAKISAVEGIVIEDIEKKKP